MFIWLSMKFFFNLGPGLSMRWLLLVHCLLLFRLCLCVCVGGGGGGGWLDLFMPRHDNGRGIKCYPPVRMYLHTYDFRSLSQILFI